ncbi:MAG TPA: AAA family ATPase, partial [Pseudonocardiaceae bacterium]|nr:AAA family ATPase [Pseudonocardiaceae bacterium]
MPGGTMRGFVGQTWPLVGRGAEKAAFDELLADPNGRGIVLCGQEGVGKSRLAEEFLYRAEQAGYLPGRAVATSAAAAVPLGAIAHLLPDDIDFTNPGAAFAAIADALSRHRRILLVDDAHLLDATSAKLLRRLTDWRAVRLVATFRGASSATAVLGNSVTCLDIDPLAEDTVAELLHVVLARPVAKRTVRLLWDASQGNPLYLREITTGALDSGALTFSGELWELDESMPLGTPRLADLIERRLHTVDPAARPVLETLALCGPVAPADLLELAPPQVLADLAAADLVRLPRNGRRGLVALEHPLYGEVIRDRIPRLLHAEILRAQADRIRRRGSKRRQDALTIVTWELAATGTSDPGLLRQAAGLAFHAADHCQVVALLTALPAGEHTTTTRLLLAQSHFLLGYWSEAETILKEASDAADNDTERLVVTTFRVTNQLWANADVAVALAVNDAMRDRIGGPAARVLLGLNEAMALLASSRPAAALALLDEIGADPELPAHEGAWVRLA